MALTVTLDTHRGAERVSRNLGMLTGTIAFDSSYPTGGEDLADISKHFKTLLAVGFEAEGGYNFAFDKTNDTVIAYYPSGTPAISAGASHTHGLLVPPRVVYEESVQAATNVGTLTFDAAHIWYVSKDTKAFVIVDKGTTPGSGEVAVDFTPATGATKLTFAAADSSPLVKVTYWPRLSNAVLFDNLVESDVVDASAASGHASISSETITITDGACAIICVDVDGTPFMPVIDDDTATTSEYQVTWDSSGDTVLVGSGSEFSGATAITITFIKLPTGWAVTEDASAHSSDVVTIVNAFYIPCNSSYLYTDDNDTPNLICNSSETLAANEVKVALRTLAGMKLTYHGDTDVAASGFVYVSLLDGEISPSISDAGGVGDEATHTHTATAEVSDEVGSTDNLAALTAVQFTAFGLI